MEETRRTATNQTRHPPESQYKKTNNHLFATDQRAARHGTARHESDDCVSNRNVCWWGLEARGVAWRETKQNATTVSRKRLPAKADSTQKYRETLLRRLFPLATPRPGSGSAMAFGSVCGRRRFGSVCAVHRFCCCCCCCCCRVCPSIHLIFPRAFPVFLWFGAYLLLSTFRSVPIPCPTGSRSPPVHTLKLALAHTCTRTHRNTMARD
mmetsp:Transcript_14292/g.32084  ORF Transcript_14292/g.32084 Transcript_14292/m.32084 type:complete len:209 (-) Transcript_14292:919-1545(-)